MGVPRYRESHIRKNGAWGPPPKPGKGPAVSNDPRMGYFKFDAGGGKIHTRLALIPVWEALDQCFLKHGYKIRNVGGYYWRDARGSSSLSSHAFGTAIDVNPPENPMRKAKPLGRDIPTVGDEAADWIEANGIWPDTPTDFPAALIVDVLRMKTTKGQPLLGFLRGRTMTDMMHLNPQQSEVDTIVDWDTVPGGKPSDVSAFIPPGPAPVPLDKANPPTLRSGDKGPAVVALDRELNDAVDDLELDIPDLAIDGTFDAATEAAVKAVQAKMGLKADGIVGPVTWKALVGEDGWVEGTTNGAPPAAAADPAPVPPVATVEIVGVLDVEGAGVYILGTDGAVFALGGEAAQYKGGLNDGYYPHEGRANKIQLPGPSDPPGTEYVITTTKAGEYFTFPHP